jgi:tetratricopeptide (TPR) repeat protein
VPIDREKVLQAAQKLIEKKRFDRAIVEYQKLVQEDPNDARTLLKIGDLQARTQMFEDAIATYERVARHYASQGFSVKAIAVYKQIREIIRKHVPNLAEQYGHIIPKLAQLYQDLGLTGDALSAYDEYASHLQRAGRDREAIGIFHKIVEINGNNPLTRLRLAEALLRQEDSDEALNQFSMASEILLGMGRSDDALKVIERMLFQKPDPAVARRAAEIYLERGLEDDGMQALAKLQICFQADNRDLSTLLLLAKAFEAIGQAPKATEVRKELARIARDQGEFGIAREAARALLTEAPNDDAVQTLARSILAAARASGMPGGRSEPAPEFHAPLPAAVPEDAVIEVSEEMVDIPEYASVDMEFSQDGTGEDEGNLEIVAGQQEDFGLGLEDSFEELEPLSDTEIGGLPDLDDLPRSVRAVYVPDGLPVAEDFDPGAQLEPIESTQQVLAAAEAFRAHGLYDKAIETLRIGLEVDPNAFDVRFALKDMLVESGDYPAACEQLITMASLYIDAEDYQSGAQFLSEVLALDPTHGIARDLLTQLGYDVGELPVLDVQVDVEGSEQRDPMSTVEGFSSFDGRYSIQGEYEHAEPLPSYDLEEINPSYAMSSVPAAERADYAALLTADDPFAAVDGARSMEPGIDEPFEDGGAPLPSFPLSEEGRVPVALADFDEAPSHPEDFGEEALTQYDGSPYGETYGAAGADGVQEQMLATGEAVAAPLAGTRAFRGGDSLEDALEEAEFFASRGLFEDALAILEEQGERFPNHPLLLERMREIAEAMSAAGSGERAVPVPDRPSLEVLEDNAFDIAASLDVLDGGPAGAALEQTDGFGKAVDVEEVFAKFKAGVRAQVSESDSQTHFDLGVAYKEMGLVDDAIAEFTMAARDPKRECVCWSMIGVVRTDIGDADGAIEAFIRGLHAEHKTIDQELSLYFDLGAVYQMRDNPQEALYYFEKVVRRDPNFRDVAQRVRSLQTTTQPSRLKVTAGEDDFDRAFDDLFGTSKLSQG